MEAPEKVRVTPSPLLAPQPPSRTLWAWLSAVCCPRCGTCPPLWEAGTLCEGRWGPGGGLEEAGARGWGRGSGSNKLALLWDSGQWLSPKV